MRGGQTIDLRAVQPILLYRSDEVIVYLCVINCLIFSFSAEHNTFLIQVDMIVSCCSLHLLSDSGNEAGNELMPRKVGEAIGSTVGAIASIVNYPLGKMVTLSWDISPLIYFERETVSC